MQLTLSLTTPSWSTQYLSANTSIHASLTIEAGVTVQVAHYSTLLIEGGGKLLASGTATHPILFQSILPNAPAGEWGQVAISSTAAAGSSLTYTTLRDGGQGAHGALYVNQHTVLLDHVTFENNLTCDVGFLNDGNVTAVASPYEACAP